jgi:hypothetical protein
MRSCDQLSRYHEAISTMVINEENLDICHPGVFAERTLDRPSVILGSSGAWLSFA